jgi:hypothetical protein
MAKRLLNNTRKLYEDVNSTGEKILLTASGMPVITALADAVEDTPRVARKVVKVPVKLASSFLDFLDDLIDD